MCSLDSLKIDLRGLSEGLTVFDFKLDNDYFAAINGEEVKRGDVDVRLTVDKAAERYYEFDFSLSGTVFVPCDRCLDDMELPIETDGHLVVKLGEEYSEDDDIVVVAENEGILDTSWFIYEFIALAIPIKHVHAPGKCNRAMIDLIEEYTATRSSDGDGEHPIDPRWSGLKEIKNNIKD